MAVSKVVNPILVREITPTYVASEYYTVNPNNGGNLFVTRCGNIVCVTVLAKVLSDDYPTGFPGQSVATGLPKPVKNIWTNAPTGFGASVQKSLAVNMSANDGALYCRYGKAGFTYAVSFSYITKDP